MDTSKKMLQTAIAQGDEGLPKCFCPPELTEEQCENDRNGASYILQMKIIH